MIRTINNMQYYTSDVLCSLSEEMPPVGTIGYFADSLAQLDAEIKENKLRKLIDVNRSEVFPFIGEGENDVTSSFYFLPQSYVYPLPKAEIKEEKE